MSMYINELKLKRVAHNLVAVSITTLRSLLILRRKLAITDCTGIFDFRLTPFSVNRHFFEELNANRNEYTMHFCLSESSQINRNAIFYQTIQIYTL